MNREIKFRQAHFRINDGSFQGFSYWGPHEGGFASPSYWSGSRSGGHQQYTGIKDKNRKEIYEGDIVLGNGIDIPSKIVWEVNGYGIQRKSIIHLTDKAWGSLEVIGNIYENPELL
jgi:hypothetical protein